MFLKIWNKEMYFLRLDNCPNNHHIFLKVTANHRNQLYILQLQREIIALRKHLQNIIPPWVTLNIDYHILASTSLIAKVPKKNLN